MNNSVKKIHKTVTVIGIHRTIYLILSVDSKLDNLGAAAAHVTL